MATSCMILNLVVVVLLLPCRFVVIATSVNCYYCAWIDNFDGYLLPSAREVSDVCRPHNFIHEVVHVQKCKIGCVTIVLQQIEEENSTMSEIKVPILGLVKSVPHAENGDISNMIHKKKEEQDLIPHIPITFFYRGCSNSSVRIKDGCEVVNFRNGFRQKACQCGTELCNGEKQKSLSASNYPAINGASYHVLALSLHVYFQIII